MSETDTALPLRYVPTDELPAELSDFLLDLVDEFVPGTVECSVQLIGDHAAVALFTGPRADMGAIIGTAGVTCRALEHLASRATGRHVTITCEASS